jgi:hypothetical protein
VEARTRSAGGVILFRLTSKESATTTKRLRQSTATTTKATTNSGEDAIWLILQRDILLQARCKLLKVGGARSLPAAARRARRSREGGDREEVEERALLGAFKAKE